ncbi:hypothetical protein ILUMI_02005 [Ignelater luminosus]|uniref:Uncharacterized protein n=1 Tax=Ignelater luminosus TaxID=2038154 RepID=A0A8K0GGW4_IGNLU|nr:hypothetical protein ILUMI_02005 [Ignelater luminosus]
MRISGRNGRKFGQMGRIFPKSVWIKRKNGSINEEVYTPATESEDLPTQQKTVEIIRKLKNNKSPGENGVCQRDGKNQSIIEFK